MKRHVTIELTTEEQTVLRLLKAATDTKELAHRAQRQAIIHAIELGLPVRMVGATADYSAAQISRISTGQA
jgi:hypothetical protein